MRRGAQAARPRVGRMNLGGLKSTGMMRIPEAAAFATKASW